MTTIKHPATLIHNGVVIAMAISFAAALGIIEQLTGLSFQRGAARARCNFYKGREYYRAVGGDYFAIVPTGGPADRFDTDYNLQQGVVAEPYASNWVRKIEQAKLPNALATYLAAALHTGNWERLRELYYAHRNLLDPLGMREMGYLTGLIKCDVPDCMEYQPTVRVGGIVTHDTRPANIRALFEKDQAVAFPELHRALASALSKITIPFKMVDPAPKPVPVTPAVTPAVTRAPDDVVIKKLGNSWAIMF